MATATEKLTPDDLLNLPRPAGGKHYELSDGNLVIVGNAGALHELIKAKIVAILIGYQLRTQSGRTFSETQFTLRADRARIPDVAWVSAERLKQIPRTNQAIVIAPDVAVEIISDSEQPAETERKLRDYLEAGVEVWQVFPAIAYVTIWQGSEGKRLTGDEVIASARLPGFRICVTDLFAE